MKKPVGVIGSGSFGTAIAKILSKNSDVYIFSRRAEIIKEINEQHTNLGIQLSDNIKGVEDLEQLAKECDVLFPIVPSASFRNAIKMMSPFLRPYHMVIHGTKGLDITGYDMDNLDKTISRNSVHTMSEIIVQETTAVRVGCLSGPNLASEILQNKPTATVIASRFDEVIHAGEKLLNTDTFHVFGTNDILGAEMAGAFKNAIAIGSGILDGMEMGKNLQSTLITRGLREMIFLAKAMGADIKTFFGTAGIGDLVATTTSPNSRNYSFGKRIGQGDKPSVIVKEMKELAEGYRTVQIMNFLAIHYKLRLPIIKMIYSIIFEDFDPEKAIRFLIKYPYGVDVDFL